MISKYFHCVWLMVLVGTALAAKKKTTTPAPNFPTDKMKELAANAHLIMGTIPVEMTWKEASAYCRHKQGNLLTLYDKVTQKETQKALSGYDEKRYFWTSGRAEMIAGRLVKFYWDDEIADKFEPNNDNWAVGNPNLDKGTRVAIRKESGYKWETLKDTDKALPLCQRYINIQWQ